MIIYNTLDEIKDFSNTIFLAGCTHRIKEGQQLFPHSWRTGAIEIARTIVKYNDVSLIIPEWKDNKKPDDWTYQKQVKWERYCLENCSVIMFWIPRSEKLPGFTTNIEFGEWFKTKPVVVGIPKECEYHVRYIKEVCLLHGIPVHDNLYYAVEHALVKIGVEITK